MKLHPYLGQYGEYEGVNIMDNLAQTMFYGADSTAKWELRNTTITEKQIGFFLFGSHCGYRPSNKQSFVLSLIEECTKGQISDADIVKPMLVEFYKNTWPEDTDLLEIVC